MIVAVAALSACSSQHAQKRIWCGSIFARRGSATIRRSQTSPSSVSIEGRGTVSDFEVTTVTPERTEPLQIIALSKTLAEAEAANKAFTERKKTYQDANWNPSIAS